ncbi:hypothetical protein [Actinomadura sp. WMMA1423]|uniref:hypothetical protein n=1 Tax=Actinomadura sp. WMMA1423 TaxID=2591108 RepID=UPI00114624D5|nr:hypothetical protein [Actinomadura sp. WMMA1423]
MDYLKGHVTASAPALVVICRYLATHPQGVEEAELRSALQPHVPAKSQGTTSDGGVFVASLRVGQDLEIIQPQEVSRNRRRWAVSESLQEEIERDTSPGAQIVRSLVLRRLGARAASAIEAGDPPPDLGLALTWFLMQNPLAPFSVTWGDGPEAAFKDGWKGDHPPVGNAEQWRSFMRWARSLGLAVRADFGRQKSVLIADPTRAIEIVLSEMPSRLLADEWFRHLHSLLPVLGDSRLVSALPKVSGSVEEVPLPVVLAMRKLERMGKLRLVASDDSSNAVALRFARGDRRIGEVHIPEALA